MTKVEEKLNSLKYSKEDILKSKKYENRKDLLNVLLKEKDYSFEEVDTLIEKFMKGKVN